ILDISRPPDNLGGWAPLGLSVSGRTIQTTISKRIEVHTGRTQDVGSSHFAASPLGRPCTSLSLVKKSPMVLKLTNRPSNYGERAARIGLMSQLGQKLPSRDCPVLARKADIG